MNITSPITSGLTSSLSTPIDISNHTGLNIGDYNFYFSTDPNRVLRDEVSLTALPAANYGGAHYNLIGTSLVSYTKDEYVRDAQGRILTFGAYNQLCRDSENPGAAGWVLVGTTRSADTANNIGPFAAHRFTSAGQTFDRVTFWRSTGSFPSGAPVGIQYIRFYYLAGTSGKIRISCRDVTDVNKVSLYAGTIGSAIVSTTDAGVLTLISDTLDASLGCRVAILKMNFTNKANELHIEAGPYSATAGQDIIVLGADVFGTSAAGDITTWRPHVPSSGAVVPISATSYNNNGGSPRGMFFPTASLPKAVIGLQGTGPGDAVGQLEWTGTPLFSASDISADQNIVVCNETTPMLNFDVAGFEVKDGTAANNLICPLSLGGELAPTGGCTDPINDRNNTTGWAAGNSAILASVVGGRTGYCLRITEGGAADPFCGHAETVIPGEVYIFQCWVKAGTEATYRIYIYNVTGGYTTIVGSGQLEASASSWTRWSASFLIPTGCVTIQPSIYQIASLGAGTTIFYDDVSLKKVTSNIVKDTEYIVKVPYGVRS